MNTLRITRVLITVYVLWIEKKNVFKYFEEAERLKVVFEKKRCWSKKTLFLKRFTSCVDSVI